MTKKLSLLGFFSLTISMVMDVYEYPIFATAQFHLVFYLIVGGILWFIPTALCSAEMATVEGWQEGGIFAWVKNTLGEKYGFAAIFFQWLQVTVGFVTMLYFIISALSYVLDVPQLNDNPLYKLICILVIFWIITLLQFRGTQQTQLITKIGSITGIIIPAILLVILTIIFVLNGNPLQLSFTNISWIPDFSKPSTLVVFISFLLSYMGVEASASYVNELDNPKKNYPLAMFFVVLGTILFNTIGGLSVAAIVPSSDLSLSGGIIQTFETLFTNSFSFLAKAVALMIALGVIGEISGWIVGPARGMYAAAQGGLLPTVFRKVNKYDVPIAFIIFQGIIVTIWAVILTFGGGGNNLSFMVAISLTVVIYVVAYLLFYVGYLVMVIKMSHLKSGYSFGKKPIKIIVAVIGLVTSIFALFISFIPPSSLSSGNALIYQMILYPSFVVVVLLPFIFYRFHDKSKHPIIKKPKHIKASESNPFVDPIARGEHYILPSDEDYL